MAVADVCGAAREKGMALESPFVGRPLKPPTTRIDWRHTMNDAAAVSDVNAGYFDDQCESGIMAAPMFSTAVTWPRKASVNSGTGVPGIRYRGRGAKTRHGRNCEERL